MTWQRVPYVVSLLTAAVVAVLMALHAWRRRSVPGAVPLMWSMLALAGWALGYALELYYTDLAAKVFWAKAQYLGIASAGVTVLLMVLQYAGYERRLTRRNLALLFVVPLVTLALVWTNEAHHLFWTEMRLVPFHSFWILDIDHGPGFWLIIAFSYLCLLAGLFVLVRTFWRASWRSPSVYRAQVGAMVLGILAPWAANALYASGLGPLPYLDLTPFAFLVTGAVATVSLFRLRFLDIMPIARAAVVEEMGDGVLVLDSQDRVVDLNPAGAKLLACTPGAIIGLPTEQLLAAWPDLVARFLDTRETHQEIVLGQGMASEWYDLRISPLHDRRGRYMGRVVVLRDISERKRAEQERERLIRELDAFAHTVAHDLKNPLTSILGHAEILSTWDGSRLSAGERECLVRIRQGSLKLQNIIDSLLLLASVRKQIEVPVALLAMEGIVGEALERLDDLIREYRAKIVLPDTWVPALGYGPWVEEVWANYVSNAIKYGGTPPHVELGCTTQPDGWVRFWVRDNGAGLTPEQQAALFAPFTRLDRLNVEGHGLGLSIVQRIIERLGGQVAVESAVGRGSTFIFSLPAAPSSP